MMKINLEECYQLVEDVIFDLEIFFEFFKLFIGLNVEYFLLIVEFGNNKGVCIFVNINDSGSLILGCVDIVGVDIIISR